jgi:REG-2-like HAD superfamily hydrolase
MSTDVQPPGVCFDATGTLIEGTSPIGETYHQVALEHGVDLPAWRLEDAFIRILRGAPPRGQGGDSFEERCGFERDWWSERIRQTFQATDSTARFVDFQGFAQALFDRYRDPKLWRIREGMIEALSSLKSAGCAMAITSNFDHRLPELLEGLDIAMFFDHIEIPALHGELKPARAIFTSASKAIRRPLDSLCYVGDDSLSTLAMISNHGLRVLDVREVSDAREIVDFVLGPSNSPATATLV